MIDQCTDLGVLFRPFHENSMGLLSFFSFSIKLVSISKVSEIVDDLYKSSSAFVEVFL